MILMVRRYAKAEFKIANQAGLEEVRANDELAVFILMVSPKYISWF